MIQVHVPDDSKINLTSRECTVLRLLCEDISTRKIAETLHLSIRTIELHRNTMRKKFKVRRWEALVYKACTQGFISEEKN